MILKDKKIVIMGIRNKWSIAWGAAQSAYEQGAQVIFTCGSMEKIEKIKELTNEIPNSDVFACDASSDESIKECFEKIKEKYGKIDGILHAIAHANTEDLRNDFILTSRSGYAHACDVSAYSLIAVAKITKELDMLNAGASIVSYTYYGAEKVVDGYNIMGAAKAALEANIRYLAKDLGKIDVRINGISAGPIKTLSAKGIKDFNSILDVVEEKAPLHKNVIPKQVGDATSFLFSDMASAITGEIIHVDNGFSIIGV
ncbi:enoyl-[acyl-carrier-protein] reductase [NADH] [Clostridium sp. CAG:356]|jgi:enoyl-[acyl-carrier-protein] reductase (NADH)|nr:MAG: enoyl-ACP reductase [Clostridiales bacterium 36_14]CDD37083.1 enoyl-[acyl-carrier-protein] reductase [NADH] [Clostridium sp. CAG:356]